MSRQNVRILFVLAFAVAGTFLILKGKASPAGQQIVSRPSGRCLDVINGGTNNGTGVQIWDCLGNANQEWQFYGDNTIRSAISGRCLDVTGQQIDNGTPLEIWDCNGGANQQWQRNGDNTIRSAQSGRCLDVRDAQTSNGTGIQIWDCLGTANQTWTVILPASSPSPTPAPAPTPTPTPSPAPSPTPTPSPAPSPSPSPSPNPSPTPAPNPGGSPSSTPSRPPATSPSPQPASSPSIQGGGSSRPPSINVTAPARDTTPPSKPEGFSAQADDQGVSILLSWQASTDNSGSANYNVERSTDGQNWQNLAEKIPDTFYTDSDVKFTSHYFYRLLAIDAAGNKSDYAAADTSAGSFNGNSSPDNQTVLTNDQNHIEATIPAGALADMASCAISSMESKVIGPSLQGYVVISGPFQILCKKSDSSVISSFEKPIAIKWTLKTPNNVAGAPEYYGDESNWTKLVVTSHDAKTHADTFNLDKGTAFIAMGKAKHSSPWVKIVAVIVGILGVVLVILGFLYWRYRRQQQAIYDDYMRKVRGG